MMIRNLQKKKKLGIYRRKIMKQMKIQTRNKKLNKAKKKINKKKGVVSNQQLIERDKIMNYKKHKAKTV